MKYVNFGVSAFPGPCFQARIQDPSITCTETGQFELLQCQENGPLITCQCVQPDSGEAIPNTEVTVAVIEDVPDCERLGKWVLRCMRRGEIDQGLHMTVTVFGKIRAVEDNWPFLLYKHYLLHGVNANI